MTKPPRALAVLLAERIACIGRIKDIDASLEKMGLRAGSNAAPRSRRVADPILLLLSAGPMASKDVAAATGQGIHAVHQLLHKMTKAGEVRRVARGVYGLAVGVKTEEKGAKNGKR